MQKHSASSLQFRGFTLVELMIVVAIISVLAAIAIPSYTKYIKKSRTAEASSNLGAIAIYQETFFSENDYYVTTPPSPSVVPKPSDPGGRRAFSLSGNWALLGKVIPNGQNVYFQYEVRAGRYGTDGVAVTSAGVSVAPNSGHQPGNGNCNNLPALTAAGSGGDALGISTAASSHWFYATAAADQDGDGSCSLFIKVIDRPDLVIENDIE